MEVNNLNIFEQSLKQAFEVATSYTKEEVIEKAEKKFPLMWQGNTNSFTITDPNSVAYGATVKPRVLTLEKIQEEFIKVMRVHLAMAEQGAEL